MSRTPVQAVAGRIALPAILAFALVLAACASEADLGGKVVKDGMGCSVTEVEANDEAPKIASSTKVGKETKTKDLTKADKKACVAGTEQYLTVNLVGATADDGKEFTNTWEDGQPITIRLGQGQLIPGLETGLASMPVGARRQITIPAEQAYADTGNEAQGIGKGEDLVFVVDLLSLTDGPTSCNEATNIPEGKRDDKPTEVKMPKEVPTDKVGVTVLEEGDGPKVTDKSYVTVDYLGVSCATGQQFDSSWDTEDHFSAALGTAEETAEARSVIPGWTEGLVGQKQGSLVQIDIPSELAYGAGGGPTGPNDPLTFVIKLHEVSEKPPAATTTTAVADPGASTTTVPADASTTTAAAGE